MKRLASWCVRHRCRRAAAGWPRWSWPRAVPVDRHGVLQQLLPAQHRVDQGPRPSCRRRRPRWPATASRSCSPPPTGPRSPTRRWRPRSPPCWTRCKASPTSPPSPALSTRWGPTRSAPTAQTGFATVTFDEQSQNISTRLAKQFVQHGPDGHGPDLQVAVAGQVAEEADRSSFGGTGLGVILAGIVLLLVFGSVFAMALPLVSALASLGTAIGLIGLLSHVLKMPQFSTELVLLIGLGVGVDYALFIVTRHRQGLIAGKRRRDLHRQRGQHLGAGRAVRRHHRLHRPARHVRPRGLLPLRAGHRRRHRGGLHHDRRAHPAPGPARVHRAPGAEPASRRRAWPTNGPRVVGAGTKGFWPGGPTSSSAGRCCRPWWPCIVIVFLALPFFSLRLGSSDQGNDPVGTTTREAYDLLAKGFGPGFNGPLLLVAVEHGAGRHPGPRPAGRPTVKAQPGVARVVAPVLAPGQGRQRRCR